MQQSIPCPECGTNIPFDAIQLMQGVKYTCSNCHASIGLAKESKTSVQEAMKKFEEVKKQIKQV